MLVRKTAPTLPFTITLCFQNITNIACIHATEHLSEQNLPAELIPQYTTLEYELPNRRAGPPVFLFVVDCCLDEEALEELKDSLQQCLNLLPDEALVGLVTVSNFYLAPHFTSQPVTNKPTGHLYSLVPTCNCTNWATQSAPSRSYFGEIKPRRHRK